MMSGTSIGGGIGVDGLGAFGALGLDQLSELHIAGLLLFSVSAVDQLRHAAGSPARAHWRAGIDPEGTRRLVSLDPLGPALIDCGIGIFPKRRRDAEPLCFVFPRADCDRTIIRCRAWIIAINEQLVDLLASVV
jgi:hypothetical protein